MNVLARLAGLMVIAAAAAAPAAAQRPHRTGLWGEVSLGPGRIRINCSNCQKVLVSRGDAANLRIGGVLSNSVLLGLENVGVGNRSFGFEQGDTSVTAEMASVNVIVIWYPWRYGFFLKGGVGIASGRFSVRTSPTDTTVAESFGSGLTFGVGWDQPISRKFAITANAGAFITAIGDVRLPASIADDVIATTYQLTIGLTFR